MSSKASERAAKAAELIRRHQEMNRKLRALGIYVDFTELWPEEQSESGEASSDKEDGHE